MNAVEAMETFIAVAEELHFTKAAKRRGVTRATATKHIQDLEQLTGRLLFIRTTRTVKLTAHGMAYLAQCRVNLPHLKALDKPFKPDGIPETPDHGIKAPEAPKRGDIIPLARWEFYPAEKDAISRYGQDMREACARVALSFCDSCNDEDPAAAFLVNAVCIQIATAIRGLTNE